MKRQSVGCSRPTLTPEMFRTWLIDRLSGGESCAAIGRSLGVTGEAVRLWLHGRSGVSDTVLLLAELLRQAPVDLAAGLPVGGDPAGS